MGAVSGLGTQFKQFQQHRPAGPVWGPVVQVLNGYSAHVLHPGAGDAPSSVDGLCKNTPPYTSCRKLRCAGPTWGPFVP